MPKVVDHDARRLELADAAWRLIADKGIEEVTTREIARESGFSNGVLQHYFEDKDAILLAAFRLSHSKIDQRYEVVTDGANALDGLRAILHDNLPEDDQRRRETRVEMSFWARALNNEALLEVQRTEADKLQGRLRALLEGAESEDMTAPALNAEDTIAILAALIDGLSLHALLYPDRFVRGRAEELMDTVLASISKTTVPKLAR